MEHHIAWLQVIQDVLQLVPLREGFPYAWLFYGNASALLMPGSATLLRVMLVIMRPRLLALLSTYNVQFRSPQQRFATVACRFLSEVSFDLTLGTQTAQWRGKRCTSALWPILPPT